MDKKAQVTLFVILGLTLLLIAVLMFSIGRLGTESTPPGATATHDFSAVIATYQAGVSSCFESVGSSTFQQLFAHGGFYDPATSGFISIPDFPTRGNAIALSEDNLIPYWVEHASSSTCRKNCPIKVNIPALESTNNGDSIEEQAENVLASTIGSCLDQITTSYDYEIIRPNDLSVAVSFSEEQIHYTLKAPIEIIYVQENTRTTVNTFTAQSNAPVKKMYQMGVALLEQGELVNTSAFFGSATKQIIDTFALSKEATIPPITGDVSFAGDSPRFWLHSEVKDQLQTYLADNIPLIEIKGSADEKLFLDSNRYSLALYNQGSFSPDLLLPHVSDLSRFSIDFLYDPRWNIDLRVSPSDGALITPESTTFGLVLFTMSITDYRFDYDIIYPVVTIIRNEEAFGGRGLSLLYAHETGLRASKPIQYGELDELVETASDPEIFAQDNQRMLGEITLYTEHALNGAAISDVELFYTCGDATVSAGKSTSQGAYASSKTSLPQCLGGFISASLTGHYANPVDLSVVGDEDYTATVKLLPFKDFDLQIRTRTLAKQLAVNLTTFWALDTSDLGYLGPDDEVVYIFTKESLPGENQYTTTGVINASVENPTVALIPGTYEVEAYLLRKFGDGRQAARHVIPSREECWDDEPLNPLNSDTCETIPAVEFNSTLYLGGVSMTGENTIEITVEDYNDSKVILPVIAINLDDLQTHEDLEVLGEIDDYSINYNESLQLVFE